MENLSGGLVSELYELGAKLGEGAFGVVRMGRIKATGTPCAVKLVSPKHYCTPAQKKLALEEVSRAHPRIFPLKPSSQLRYTLGIPSHCIHLSLLRFTRCTC